FPPLAVTGSLADPFPGALDQPGTRVLFGAQGAGYGTFSGLRLEGGAWLDREQRFAVEGGGFLLERRAAGFRAATDANGQAVLGLDEDLQVLATSSTNQVFDDGTGGPLLLVPFSSTTFDSFRVSNRFYGPQLGGRLSWTGGPLAVDLVSKLAVGTTQELATIT